MLNSFLAVRSLSDRLKLWIQQCIHLLCKTLIDFNIFPNRTFGSHVDQMTAKRLGQLATRLYFILLTINFVILTLYIIIQQQTLTKEFNKPSFDTYKQLEQIYGEQLQCLCSSVSLPYKEFVEIKPKFHPICSSVFVSNEMIANLEISLLDSQSKSIINEGDYRIFISSHIQYLTGLCRISIESVNNTIKQLLSRLLIRKQLLSEYNFNEHINSLIEQTKHNAPETLNLLFSLVENITFGAAIVSSFETNYRYSPLWLLDLNSFSRMEAEIYNNNCSCGLQSDCTSQALFFEINSTSRLKIWLSAKSIISIVNSRLFL